MSKISRRDFLKLMGFSGLALFLGRFQLPVSDGGSDPVATPPQPPPPSTVTSRDVLTQHNNNERTGAYIQPGLNRSTFAPKKRWGLKGVIPVQGPIYAQPLYVENVPIGANDSLHNVVFIVTIQNNVYAFDADSLQQLWLNRLGQPDKPDNTDSYHQPNQGGPILSIDTRSGAVLGGGFGTGNISTPVIDRNTEKLYVSYRRLFGPPFITVIVNGKATKISQDDHAHQFLAVLSIRDGRILKEAEVTASDPNFNLVGLRQRPGLLLLNGIIYVAFGSRFEGLAQPKVDQQGHPVMGYPLWYNGWILAYDAATLKHVGTYSTTRAKEGLGGIWQASAGLAGDTDGSIYFITGNGTFTRDGTNLGTSVVRIKPDILRDSTGSISGLDMKVIDWFTPYRQMWLGNFTADLDLGSAGPMLIPNTRFLVCGGKQGIIYLINRDNMGKIDTVNEDRWNSIYNKCVKPAFDGHIASFVLAECLMDLHTTGDKLLSASTYPENFSADHVVYKFQATENRYLKVIPRPKELVMFDWLIWPHIHGSPVYADFNNGKSMLYVWPEKDYLKGYQRIGSTFLTSDPHILRGGILAPANNVGYGMPGGMLSLSVDPTVQGGGVLFASCPQDADGILHGKLYAYDPMNLAELWDNTDTPRSYFDAHFCVPTVANGKVFLPTFSNKVLVYGEQSTVGFWQRGPIISSKATGSSCIIQSDFTSGPAGTTPLSNFEAVVLEGRNLVHYFNAWDPTANNGRGDRVWKPGPIISSKATGPACIIQSDFTSGPAGNVHRNFEAVVLEGNNLVHYFQEYDATANNGRGDRVWKRGGIITSNATGPGWIIQSDFKRPNQQYGLINGDFEVIVQESNNLTRYILLTDLWPWPFLNNAWQRVHYLISSAATGSGTVIQSNFRQTPDQQHGNFEAVVLEGNALVHYFRVNLNILS
jgi:hypothetical protein